MGLHPWAVRLHNNVRQLLGHPTGAIFQKAWGPPTMLFRGERVRQAYIARGMRLFRSAREQPVGPQWPDGSRCACLWSGGGRD
eukprot:3251879-Pyramimonas_sp.AAC.1